MFASKIARSNLVNVTQSRGSHSSSLLREFAQPHKHTEINYNLSDYFTGEVNVSKLVNGVNVISKNGSGLDTSFGVYVNAGRNKEESFNAGVTSYIPRLAFQSTVNTSGLRVTRYVESITSDFSVSAGRETVEYHANFLKPNAENVATSIAEILRPRVAEWEVRDSKEEIDRELNNTTQDVSQRIVNAIYYQAYKGQGVGRLPSHNYGSITPSLIRDFVANNFVGNAVTVVGVGISHSTLLDASEAFSYLPLQEKTQIRSVYYGGDYIEEDSSLRHTHVAFAFPISPENIATLRVLACVLGTKVNKERTVIGEGASSRLFSVITGSPNLFSSSAFVLDASNGGGHYPFFVLQGSSNPESTAELTKTLSQVLSAAQDVSQAELQRAINLAKLQLSSQIEKKDSLKNLLYFNNGKNPVSYFAELSAVTPSSLKQVVSSTFSVRPTVVCIGNLNGFSY